MWSCSSHLRRSFTLASSLGSVIQIEIATLRRINSGNSTNNISLAHHLSDRRQQKERRKGRKKQEKILACPPIFHSLCTHPSWVCLLIWACHRLGNRDLQPLETNDLGGEGQQLTAGGATLLSCWGLLSITGARLKCSICQVFSVIVQSDKRNRQRI